MSHKLLKYEPSANVDHEQFRLIGQSEGKLDIVIGMLEDVKKEQESQNKRLSEVERKVNLVFAFFKDPKRVLGAVFAGGSGYAGVGWLLELLS